MSRRWAGSTNEWMWLWSLGGRAYLRWLRRAAHSALMGQPGVLGGIGTERRR